MGWRLFGVVALVLAGCGGVDGEGRSGRLDFHGCPPARDIVVARGADEAEAVTAEQFAQELVVFCDLERDVTVTGVSRVFDFRPRSRTARRVTFVDATWADQFEVMGDVEIVAPELIEVRNFRNFGTTDPPGLELPSLLRLTDLTFFVGDDDVIRLPQLLYAANITTNGIVDAPLLELAGDLSVRITDANPQSLQRLTEARHVGVSVQSTLVSQVLPVLARAESVGVSFEVTTTASVALPELMIAEDVGVSFRTSSATVTAVPKLLEARRVRLSGEGPQFASLPALSQLSALSINAFRSLRSFSLPHITQLDEVEFIDTPSLRPCLAEEFIDQTRPTSVALQNLPSCPD